MAKAIFATPCLNSSPLASWGKPEWLSWLNGCAADIHQLGVSYCHLHNKCYLGRCTYQASWKWYFLLQNMFCIVSHFNRATFLETDQSGAKPEEEEGKKVAEVSQMLSRQLTLRPQNCGNLSSTCQRAITRASRRLSGLSGVEQSHTSSRFRLLLRSLLEMECYST